VALLLALGMHNEGPLYMCCAAYGSQRFVTNQHGAAGSCLLWCVNLVAEDSFLSEGFLALLTRAGPYRCGSWVTLPQSTVLLTTDCLLGAFLG
jgi:hypothetical protein